MAEEEPLFPVVLSSRKVWNFLRKHPYQFFTIDEIAEATGLKRDTVNSSMMWVTRDPRVVKRRRDKGIVEFGFVRILGFLSELEGGDKMELSEKEIEELLDVLRRDREAELQLKLQKAKWEKERAMKKAEEEEEKKEKEEDEKQNEE